jgi:hypothetical protein
MTAADVVRGPNSLLGSLRNSVISPRAVYCDSGSFD